MRIPRCTPRRRRETGSALEREAGSRSGEFGTLSRSSLFCRRTNQGASTGRAEEIAARTVNKNRAQSGESRSASKSSTRDTSPQKRGGKRYGNREGPGGPTKDQLYNEAKKRDIKGRSSMTKKELENALGR
ncbi:hypothetical protein GCM10027598_59160 [Amycolatopsis oliviviridis]|uniref:Plasmid stabilization protein n=1 Tax=Amycolatopsis oliviviridis TaxID=1471590 RepID=A0ABQ3LXC8_9PSEU|nr:hypothetical protein [Amycolatopsis oliviviridis]GHH28645.1 hypothetical protein GCM10017790_59810 [Amycolatopsis oliviviridis]